MTALQKVLGALSDHGSKVKPNRGQYLAQCPAHDDRNPSLSVAQGDQGAVLYCFAGCQTDAILGALGLTKDDLFDDQPERRERTTAKPTTGLRTPWGQLLKAIYPYRDNGIDLFFVGRNFDKADGFPQWTPSGAKVADLPDEVRGTPYEIDHIRADPAVATRVVDSCEGEGDALAIEREGGLATTMAGGAKISENRARVDAYVAHLIKARVRSLRIIADRDENGRKHAQRVAQACHRAGLTFAAFEFGCDDGCKDPRAAIDAHGSDWETHLVPLQEPAEPTTEQPERSHTRGLVLTPLSEIRSMPTSWVWSERIPAGELTLLVGAEGQGKSLLAIELASRLTRGQLDGDLRGQPVSVIYYASEDSAQRIVKPRFEVAGGDLDRASLVGFKGDALTLSEHVDELRDRINESAAKLIIIDPLVSAMSNVDTWKSGPVREVLEKFRDMLEDTGVACIGVIHTNRNETRVVLDRISESKAFSRIARAAIGFGTDANDESSRLVAQIKNNLGRMDLPVLRVGIEGRMASADGIEIKSAGIVWQGEAEGASAHQIFSPPPPADEQSARKELVEAIEAILQEGGEMTRKELFRALKEEGLEVSDRTFKRALSQAKVEHERSGYPSVSRYRYSRATPHSRATVGPVHGFGGLTDVSRENTLKTEGESLSWATGGYVGPTGGLTDVSDPEPQVIHSPEAGDVAALCSICHKPMINPDSIARGFCEPCRLHPPEPELADEPF